ALRTTFRAIDGQPVQQINCAEPVNLPVADLSGLMEVEREREADRLAAEEARRPFDLRRDLMLRCKLLKLGEQDHAILLTLHHIAGDGWSLNVLKAELTALYQAFSQGRPSPLPELPIQYADFAHWQREYLRGEVVEEQLAYWRERLAE